MKKSNSAFIKELSFEEKKQIVLSHLEFDTRNIQFEVDNGLAAMTQDQIAPIFAELRGQISKVEAMPDNAKNSKGLSEALKDLLVILKRGQREDTCRRLNFSLKQTLPDALFSKLYDFVGIPPEDLVLDNTLYPPPS